MEEGKRGSIYPALKKLGLRPGLESKNVFSLPDHVEKGLTAIQSADAIASHFSAISQEFQPISKEILPHKICAYLEDYTSVPPNLSEEKVYSRIVKAKKPNSKVPGDLEPRLVKIFPHLLAGPVTKIFNVILSSAVYPSSWKLEHQVPIPKVDLPENEDQLRNIAKTPFFSKVFESFVAEWLLLHIKPYLDPNQ